jgi:hypothetical protein
MRFGKHTELTQDFYRENLMGSSAVRILDELCARLKPAAQRFQPSMHTPRAKIHTPCAGVCIVSFCGRVAMLPTIY